MCTLMWPCLYIFFHLWKNFCFPRTDNFSFPRTDAPPIRWKPYQCPSVLSGLASAAGEPANDGEGWVTPNSPCCCVRTLYTFGQDLVREDFERGMGRVSVTGPIVDGGRKVFFVRFVALQRERGSFLFKKPYSIRCQTLSRQSRGKSLFVAL